MGHQADVDHRAELLAELERKDVRPYCPLPGEDVQWDKVWAEDGAGYQVDQGVHHYRVRFRITPPDPALAAVEGKMQSVTSGSGTDNRNSVVLRGDIWIIVSATVEGEHGWRSAPKAQEAFAESLVECSPQELAAHGRAR